MSDDRIAEARALYASLDRMTRNPKRITPSAPVVIPAIMIAVCSVALICILIKLIMKFVVAKRATTSLGSSQANSPDIPTTPEDQTSMATTASMKTRGSLAIHSQQRKSKPAPVSLYQIRQKQSPTTSATKHKAMAKAMSKAARAEANKSLSKDSNRQNQDTSDNDERENSPGGISQNSDDTDEVVQSIEEHQTGILYAAGVSRGQDDNDGPHVSSHNPNQPEVHIVRIRDIEDNVQQAWPQTESDI